jgi:hypothetical protein
VHKGEQEKTGVLNTSIGLAVPLMPIETCGKTFKIVSCQYYYYY